MGTWGINSFENDDALDWVAQLDQARGTEPLENALNRVIRIGDLGASASAVALAAAEVVASLRARSLGGLPREVESYVARHNSPPSAGLTGLALQATQKVKSESSLRELWEDSDACDDWLAHVSQLEFRLGSDRQDQVQEGVRPTVRRRRRESNQSLHQAIERGDLQEVKRLLETDPKIIDARGQHGYTPFDLAASLRRDDMVELLLTYDPDVNLRDNSGATPLEWAAGYCSAKIVELLIARGADVNARDKEAATPLHLAAASCLTENARLLLRNGASINAFREFMVVGDER